MPFANCRQTLGRAFAQPPCTAAAADGADARSVARLGTGDIMSSSPCVIAILIMTAMLEVPLLAQENSPATPTQASQSQSQLQPSQPPDVGNPRFAFHRVDGGFLRLDLHTGAVASCSQDAAGWTCVPAREERTALDREIARLQRDNAALKNALLEHGVPLPKDMEADSPPTTPTPPSAGSGGGRGRGEAKIVPRPPQTVPPSATTPPPPAKSAESDRASRDDAEIERIMTVMERVWRRLIEMMMNIQRDMEKKG